MVKNRLYVIVCNGLKIKFFFVLELLPWFLHSMIQQVYPRLAKYLEIPKQVRLSEKVPWVRKICLFKSLDRLKIFHNAIFS